MYQICRNPLYVDYLKDQKAKTNIIIKKINEYFGD
jgi:hypothetical protein